MSADTARAMPVLATTDWLQLLPPAARYILQGGPEARQQACAVLGLAPIESAGCASTNANAALLWLGPQENLLIDWRGNSPAIASQLATALTGVAHSVVDIGHRQLGLNVTGDFAAELLACACPRDLDIEAFPVGACGRTLFGKAEIVLWRRAPRNFHIEVWRSYAEYVTLWLIEASRDFQIQENRP